MRYIVVALLEIGAVVLANFAARVVSSEESIFLLLCAFALAVVGVSVLLNK